MDAEAAKQLAGYQKLTKEEVLDRIRGLKSRLGEQLVILGHHYQTDDIVGLSDFRGDSFKLSKLASEQEKAKYIVFCGVHFMAESAAVLARPGQAVFIPDLSAGCPMADMAFISQVENAWQKLGQFVELNKVAPLVYVNSEAELKAFSGARNGSCTTSSNADKIFRWAFSRAEKIFFFPDEHLGRNTAFKIGLSEKEILVYDPAEKFERADPEAVKSAKVIVWKGYCHVHTFFTVDHIKAAREKYPDAKIIVHPECPRPVAELADETGSTEFIIKYADSQPMGSTVVVGTEAHLVERLAREQAGKRTVAPLARSMCPNMTKINPAKLLLVLERLELGESKWVNRVTVPEPVKSQARLALQTMLKYG